MWARATPPASSVNWADSAVWSEVWSGHSCPLPLTLTFKRLCLPNNQSDLVIPTGRAFHRGGGISVLSAAVRQPGCGSRPGNN